MFWVQQIQVNSEDSPVQPDLPTVHKVRSEEKYENVSSLFHKHWIHYVKSNYTDWTTDSSKNTFCNAASRVTFT